MYIIVKVQVVIYHKCGFDYFILYEIALKNENTCVIEFAKTFLDLKIVMKKFSYFTYSYCNAWSYIVFHRYSFF